MPVSTQLLRKVAVEIRWGWWHINCLADAMRKEDPEVELYMGFPNAGTFVFKNEHTFVDESDGEVFTILPGDEYSAWR